MNDQAKPVAWHPVYDAHAVEQAAFILQFDRVVEQNDFLKANKVANEKFANDFPRRGLVPAPMIAMGMGNIPPLMVAPMGGGFIFQKYQDNGQIDAELRFDGASVAFRTLKYTRWEKIWGSARSYFTELLPIFAHSAVLVSIGLQYTNKFVLSNARSDVGVKNLFKDKSKYIAPYAYQLDDLWHNHTGAFTRPDDQTKRLININIDCLDEPSGEISNRIISINTSLTDSFNQPGYEAVTITEEKVNDLCDNRMQAFHKLNKEVLADVISDEMVKRIDLWAA